VLAVICFNILLKFINKAVAHSMYRGKLQRGSYHSAIFLD
jgi:hypothetical protein